MKRTERREGGRMHCVPGCTSRNANSLPSYLTSAVVKRIYRSLLANVAGKKGLPGRIDKKNNVMRKEEGDRIGCKNDGGREAKCGRN